MKFFSPPLTAILFFTLTPLAAQTVVRGPYLQQPTADGVTVRWRTDVPTASRVLYRATGGTGPMQNSTDAKLTTEHEITLKDLRRDVRFDYEIGTTAQSFGANVDQFFRTTPAADTQRSIRFWAMGDFGAGDTDKYRANQRMVRDQFLAHKKGPVDLWVWLGDNAYCCGTQAEYQTQVFDYYTSALLGNMPILPSPGNHEYYYPTLATADPERKRDVPYFDIVTTPSQGEAGGVPSGTEAYYATDYGGIHFISLDSYGYDPGRLPLSDSASAQYQWLEKDLAANAAAGKSRWAVVFMHHPPYTKRSHDSDAAAELRAIRQALVPVFDRYKVDLVLAGHSHVYERSYLMKGHTDHSATFNKPQHEVQNTDAHYTVESPPIINKDEGTVYMVIGSAGRLDWNGRPDPHPTSIYSNYQMGGSTLFTVTDNRLDGEWIAADGQIRDRFTMFKNVNKRVEKQIAAGASVTLAASWPGSYRWSTGQAGVSSISVQPPRDTVITVRDSLDYLQDTFVITVQQPQPVPEPVPEPVVTATGPVAEFIIYPNPGHDRLLIELPGKTPASMLVTLTDMTGRTVVERTLEADARPELDIRALPAGAYVVRVMANGQTWQRLIVKP